MIARACISIMWIMSAIMISTVCAADLEMEVNYDIGNYKLLQVGKTLELICKNLLNRDPPSWIYSSRLNRDPRMSVPTNWVNESRLVINNATAEDAGQYVCSSKYDYNGKTHHFSRTIEVIVNEIKDVKVEKEKDSIKLLCDVCAKPSATIIWKIDYVNEALNPQPEEPGEDDYWIPPDEKVVVDKSEGRWTLRPYKGVNNAELIIANVTENDDGKYYCVARNLAGEQSKECTVRVTREAAVEGLGGEIITLLVLSSIIMLGSVLGNVIILWRRQLHKEEEKRNKQREDVPLRHLH